MNELEWAKSVQDYVNKHFKQNNSELEMRLGANLPYGNEIIEYVNDEPIAKSTSYETDLLVVQKITKDKWIPRVVVECKIDSVTTHDAITYSEKAFAHKRVHPYLRYGIMLGNRKTYPLPGRLFRHGLFFDFMASWVSFEPTNNELGILFDILSEEVNASANLQEMIFESRSSSRERYVALHRRLVLTKTK